jgi:hypothetical protein
VGCLRSASVGAIVSAVSKFLSRSVHPPLLYITYSDKLWLSFDGSSRQPRDVQILAHHRWRLRTDSSVSGHHRGPLCEGPLAFSFFSRLNNCRSLLPSLQSLQGALHWRSHYQRRLDLCRPAVRHHQRLSVPGLSDSAVYQSRESACFHFSLWPQASLQGVASAKSFVVSTQSEATIARIFDLYNLTDFTSQFDRAQQAYTDTEYGCMDWYVAKKAREAGLASFNYR